MSSTGDGIILICFEISIKEILVLFNTSLLNAVLFVKPHTVSVDTLSLYVSFLSHVAHLDMLCEDKLRQRYKSCLAGGINH